MLPPPRPPSRAALACRAARGKGRPGLTETPPLFSLTRLAAILATLPLCGEGSRRQEHAPYTLRDRWRTTLIFFSPPPRLAARPATTQLEELFASASATTPKSGGGVVRRKLNTDAAPLLPTRTLYFAHRLFSASLRAPHRPPTISAVASSLCLCVPHTPAAAEKKVTSPSTVPGHTPPDRWDP